MTCGRRDFLRATLGLSLASTAHLPAAAQSRRMVPEIGVVFANQAMSELTGPAPSNWAARALLSGLRELGWTERKVRIHWRSAEERYDRRPAIFDELLRLPVDLVVTEGNASVVELLQKTRTVPIVSVGMVTPMQQGFVKSIAQPGGTVTGLMLDAGMEIAGKRLGLLKQLAPRATRIACLVPWYAPQGPLIVEDGPEMRAAAQALGLTVFTVRQERPDGLEAAIESGVRQGANALFIGSWAPYSQAEHLERIARVAMRHRLPTVFTYAGGVRSGGLVGYFADLAPMFHRAATMVAKILDGARPGDIPIEHASRFVLAINLDTARELGLTVPASLLAAADRLVGKTTR